MISKFVPIIGAYMVQMLRGNSDPGKAAKWAWNREGLFKGFFIGLATVIPRGISGLNASSTGAPTTPSI